MDSSVKTNPLSLVELRNVSLSATVGIIMGSPSDQGVMDKAVAVLDELGITHETVVSSAHRNPERTATWASEAAGRGIKVIIAGAG